MQKVKMLTETRFQDEVLFKDDVISVEEAVALRWERFGIAEKLSKENKEEVKRVIEGDPTVGLSLGETAKKLDYLTSAQAGKQGKV